MSKQGKGACHILPWSPRLQPPASVQGVPAELSRNWEQSQLVVVVLDLSSQRKARE